MLRCDSHGFRRAGARRPIIRTRIRGAQLTPIRGVVFDAYGTLVHIADRRMPYRRLTQIARSAAPPVVGTAVEWARILMTEALHIDAAAARLGVILSPSQRDELLEDLRAEICSLEVYSDVHVALQALRGAGIKIAVCSNLALPYGPPVRALLPEALDAYVWSYEAGYMKPEAEIYLAAANAMSLLPKEVLFVGDTLAADVQGPRAVGMRSVHLVRGAEPCADTIASLGELSVVLTKAAEV